MHRPLVRITIIKSSEANVVVVAVSIIRHGQSDVVVVAMRLIICGSTDVQNLFTLRGRQKIIGRQISTMSGMKIKILHYNFANLEIKLSNNYDFIFLEFN